MGRILIYGMCEDVSVKAIMTRQGGRKKGGGRGEVFMEEG